PRFGARLNVKGEGAMRRVRADAPGSPVQDELSSVVTSALDLIFVTDKGLELFAGVEAHAYGTGTRTEDSLNGETKTLLAATHVIARRFGVVRRAGMWSGGFYYVAGGEA